MENETGIYQFSIKDNICLFKPNLRAIMSFLRLQLAMDLDVFKITSPDLKLYIHIIKSICTVSVSITKVHNSHNHNNHVTHKKDKDIVILLLMLTKMVPVDISFASRPEKSDCGQDNFAPNRKRVHLKGSPIKKRSSEYVDRVGRSKG